MADDAKKETQEELQMRLGRMVDDMLAKEGYELDVAIQKMAVRLQPDAPIVYLDRPVVIFKEKKTILTADAGALDALKPHTDGNGRLKLL